MVRVHINRNTIGSNRKHGKNEPPIAIRRSGNDVEYAHRVKLIGNAEIVYSPDKPLHCGARVWIEADDAERVA